MLGKTVILILGYMFVVWVSVMHYDGLVKKCENKGYLSIFKYKFNPVWGGREIKDIQAFTGGEIWTNSIKLEKHTADMFNVRMVK